MSTILILDDRATNRTFLTTLLGYAGHTMLEAAQAETALSMARDTRPDLVIADVLMPEIDGFEFVKRLRADPSIAHTRVIFYTATYIESETRTLASALGVSCLLTKPSEPQIILNAVQTMLENPVEAVRPLANEMFAEQHQRLLLDKLAQKVDELEALNSGLETINAALETQVSARTAELGAANTRLRELNTFKDNVLATASHDMRSPLGAIYSLSQLLIEEADDPDETCRLAQQIAMSTNHLVALVNNMLDLSKLEAGTVTLEPIELRAGDVARWALQTLEPAAHSKQISLELQVAPDEPIVRADWMKLSQIMTNLLSNAIKFTPPGGHVAVLVEPEDGGVRVQVSDDGLGIPAEELPHLFEKFHQVHALGTANERGSGLGLAIVQQLVELHSGALDVASTPGQGSVFTVHLPCSSQ